MVIEALRQVFDHEEEARVQQMSADGALAVPSDRIVGPIMERLKHWLDEAV